MIGAYSMLSLEDSWDDSSSSSQKILNGATIKRYASFRTNSTRNFPDVSHTKIVPTADLN
jgi:hypothetical protein